jgi:hypothetical protein
LNESVSLGSVEPLHHALFPHSTSPYSISFPTIPPCASSQFKSELVREQCLKNGASHQGTPDWRTAAARCGACELNWREKKPKVAMLAAFQFWLTARLRRAVLQLWQEMNEDASRK